LRKGQQNLIECDI